MSNIYRKFKKQDELFIKVIRSKQRFKHIDRMTAENLREKGEIANELAYRDIQIDELEARIKELEQRCKELIRIYIADEAWDVEKEVERQWQIIESGE